MIKHEIRYIKAQVSVSRLSETRHPFMLEAGPVVSKPEGGSVFRPRKTPAEITGPLVGNFEAEERGHNGK
ncbi:hypothetical protein CMK12_05815 [Candidatus Poribacteria bacterium]|jgi:hypothetical protein|nr:hypothetical protein [Candidatus Poribacteria bacterium]